MKIYQSCTNTWPACTKIDSFHSHLPKVHDYFIPRTMADRSFKWAAEKGSGFFRKHPVHGEEEAKLVLTDAFNVNEQDGNEMTCKSSFNVEDSGDNLLNQVEGVDVEDEVPPETPPATAAGSFKFHPHLFWKM